MMITPVAVTIPQAVNPISHPDHSAKNFGGQFGAAA